MKSCERVSFSSCQTIKVELLCETISHSRCCLGQDVCQAMVPSLNKVSSNCRQSLYDSSFSVMGPKLWNAIPYRLNTIMDFVSFKSNLTTFMLTLPDKPPVRGYSAPNSNSLLAWRVDTSAAELWGGQIC